MAADLAPILGGALNSLSASFLMPLNGRIAGISGMRRMAVMAAFRLLAALAAGHLLGLGLAVSGMLNPAKVKAFLDVVGAWDPSLLFVLGAGVLGAFVGYRLAFALGRPPLDNRLHLPAKAQIDRPLIAGSAIFGVGWGLVGFCPGPAVSSLSTGLAPAEVFAIAMLVGMVFHDRFVAAKG